jgi:hypothetical protein
MRVLERKIYGSNNYHVGSIFTFFEPLRVDNQSKKVIEGLIRDYVNENIHSNQIGNLFLAVEKDMASITVFFDLNSLESVEHNFDFANK